MWAALQKPVHIAFACLVGNRDLLYSVYSVPCIAVCRAEQRDGARRRLGLPPTVWADLGIACPSVVMPGPRRPVPTPLSTQKRSPAAADEQAPAEGAEAAQAPTMHQLWDEFAKQLPVATGASESCISLALRTCAAFEHERALHNSSPRSVLDEQLQSTLYGISPINRLRILRRGG